MRLGGIVFATAAIMLHAETVPFVGCATTGQFSDKAPQSGPREMPEISREDAATLAYYAFTLDKDGKYGSLAPLGWNCLAFIRSSGPALVISPRKIDDWGNLSGPAVIVQWNYNSGRLKTGELVARAFPHYHERVKDYKLLYGRKYQFQAFPGDTIRARSPEVVEFRTAANAKGLGNFTEGLSVRGSAIYGAALLSKPNDDYSVLVSVRLTPENAARARFIVTEVIRKWAPLLQSQ
jgi:hypothetical protein